MGRNHIPRSCALVRAHMFEGARPSERLIVLGAVHGNETCGTIAIERLLHELMAGKLEITSGQLTLVPVTNRLAYERGTRNGDRNLNRNLQPTETPQDNEDRIANELCPLLAAHDVLLDIHSFGSPSAPFVLLGPENNQGELQPFQYAAKEEALAERLGVNRAVDGWLATNALDARRAGYGCGTTEYMRSVGGYGVMLESGQHNDPDAREVAYRAIRRTLAHLRLIDAEAPKRENEIESLRICQVIHRASANDRLARKWNSFDRLRRGDVVGYRANDEPVFSPGDGFILFPNAEAAPGTEWFYFARRHPRLLK